VLSGRRKEALEGLAGKLGARCHILTAALDDRDALKKLVKDSQEAMGGRIDILVNNAGHTKDNLAMRMSDDAWDDVIEVDLTAPFLLTRECLRPMIKNRWGRIISITSVVGEMGNAGQANYAAAKAGLTAMSKSLAKEIANRGITVNCVAPGFIETAMTDALNEKQREAIVETIPAVKLGAPEDIAAAVAFLASEDAGYITGQTLHINGGMAMP
jgi:3-oxoacyl-[acyl-carrier protein] reductase